MLLIIFSKKYQITIFDKNRVNYSNQKYNFIKGDITDESKVLKSVKGMDLVMNFAGISDLNYAVNNPKETVQQNICGNLNILSACKKNKVKNLFMQVQFMLIARKEAIIKVVNSHQRVISKNFQNKIT